MHIIYNSFSVAFKMPEIFEVKVDYPPKKVEISWNIFVWKAIASINFVLGIKVRGVPDSPQAVYFKLKYQKATEKLLYAF